MKIVVKFNRCVFYSFVRVIIKVRHTQIYKKDRSMQQVKLLSADEKLIFSLSGEIDSATSEDFYAHVTAAYEHDKKDVYFDCAALTFIDSTTLGTFVKLLKKLKTDGHAMVLDKVRPNVKKLFEICALDTIMEIRQ